jgi:class 3 adenylate cyclase
MKDTDEFTAIGSHVNLASRLEKKAMGNQIIVSSYTKERIEFLRSYKNNINYARGRDKSIRAYTRILSNR